MHLFRKTLTATDTLRFKGLYRADCCALARAVILCFTLGFHPFFFLAMRLLSFVRSELLAGCLIQPWLSPNTSLGFCSIPFGQVEFISNCRDGITQL